MSDVSYWFLSESPQYRPSYYDIATLSEEEKNPVILLCEMARRIEETPYRVLDSSLLGGIPIAVSSITTRTGEIALQNNEFFARLRI